MIFDITADTLLIIVTTFLSTIVLSLILLGTYYKTTTITNTQANVSFLQSLLLMPTVAAMIMQSIGNSLALGFGIFGALAIIRFRTNIADLRDISFIFVAMAIGITCGVHSFYVATIGTFVFCVITYFLFLNLNYVNTKALKNENALKIKITGINNNTLKENIENIIKNYCSFSQLLKFRHFIQKIDNVEINEHEYYLKLNNFDDINELKSKINSFENVLVDRIIYESKPLYTIDPSPNPTSTNNNLNNYEE